MKVSAITKKIDSFAPVSLACSWDNPGLLCGDPDKEVSTALLTLDISLKTVKEAISCGADMIVSHHPLFLSGIKRIDFSTTEGRLIELMVKHDLAVFAAHTNMDAAEHGINARLAELFELSEVGILEPVDEKTGIGRFGLLPNETEAEVFAEKVKNTLSTPFVRISNPKRIKRLAICSGGGADYVKYALKNDCDCLLTGDVKYHNALDAAAEDICIIDAGHFPTEKLVCDIFAELLNELPLQLIISKDCDIFKII